jgi:hypothetical protein
MWSLAMSFFGYLYEQIDFIPNFFSENPAEKQQHWKMFHQLTNPAYYHIFPALVSLACLVPLWITNQEATRKQLIVASSAVFLINLFTAIAVLNINDTLYFGNQLESDAAIRQLAVIWSVINSLRLIFIYIAFRALVKIKASIP